MQRALVKLGVPGRDDLKDLSSRVDGLTAELRRQGGKPAARKQAPARKATSKKATAKKAKASPVTAKDGQAPESRYPEATQVGHQASELTHHGGPSGR